MEAVARRLEKRGAGIEELRSRTAFMALEREWDELAEAVAPGQPFYRHAFIRVWLDNFAPRANVRVLVERDGAGQLTAVLPLVHRRTSFYGVPVQELAAAGNAHSCRFELLARDPSLAAPAMMSHLVAQKDWDLLRLIDVPERGAAWHLLESAQARGLPHGTWDSLLSPTIPLTDTWEAFQGTLSSKFRANLRRRRRKLEERGEVTFERFTRGPELLHKLEEGFALEASGWKGARGSAMGQDPATRGFYMELAREAAADGSLVLAFLRLNGRAVGFHFALARGGRYFLLKPGYDEALSECSPGQLLMEEVLKDCIARGFREFDFLGPDMVWKRDWTSAARQHTWLYVFRDGVRGRALHAAKFKLIPVAKETVAKWKR